MESKEESTNMTDATGSNSTHATAPPPPTKGLLLRVKRRRNESPLETLVVRSERQEKRAALTDLRTAFAGAQLEHSGEDAVPPDPAIAQAASSGVTPASDGAATGTTTTSTNTLFKSRSAPSTATARVFRLLTSTAAPKESHGREATILARIASMRARASASHSAAAPAHPAHKPGTAEVHNEHILRSTLSTGEKRQLVLQQNRAKLASLQQSHLAPAGPQILCDGTDLQLSIVDVNPRSERDQPRKKYHTTFEPAPMTAAEARQAQKAMARSSRVSIEPSSHRAGVSSQPGSSMDNSTVDPFEAAKQFTQAMSVVKRMPDNKQMDAYKGLLDIYLSTLPPTAKEEVQKQQHVDQQQQKLGTPANASALGKVAEESTSTATSSSPSTNRLAPKIPQRRKKPPTQPVEMEGDSSSSVIVPEMVDPSAPISFANTPDLPRPEHIFLTPTIQEQQPTAGGRTYNPAALVPATGRSMHHTGTSQSASSSNDHAMNDDTDEMEDPDYVYDVYELDDSVAPAGAASNQPDDDDYKSRYHGASSAYVTLKDGYMHWISGSDALVHEGDTSDTEDAHGDRDEGDEESEVDYPEEEDSSAAEDQDGDGTESDEDHLLEGDSIHASRMDGDYVPSGSASSTQQDIWQMAPHHQQAGSIRLLKKAALKPHGFLREKDSDDDDDELDSQTRQVRRMAAAGHSSDEDAYDDEGRHTHATRAQDDEDYTDTIEAEEDMEYMRDEREEDD